jgi:hypothetical protein
MATDNTLLKQLLEEQRETNRLLRILAGETPRPPQPRRY